MVPTSVIYLPPPGFLPQFNSLRSLALLLKCSLSDSLFSLNKLSFKGDLNSLLQWKINVPTHQAVMPKIDTIKMIKFRVMWLTQASLSEASLLPLQRKLDVGEGCFNHQPKLFFLL